MKRFWDHVRGLWPGYSIHLPLILTYWCVVMGALGMLHLDHVAAAAAVLVLSFAHQRTKRFVVAFSGYLGVAWMYDASRFVRNVGVTEDRVLLCNLHQAEMSLFGITVDGQRQTLQDYFQVHHYLGLDLLCAFPYGLFLVIAAGYAVYLFFKDERACLRYSLGFFVLNLLGIITYHVAPAAPPWYFHKWGCVVDLGSSSFAGMALSRVDEFLGIGYFHSFYGRASEVFGAIPSLHVAYPLLMTLEGWGRHKKLGRALAVFYCVWMSFAAVYTDHHWVIDVVLGWIYCVGVFLAMRRLLPLRAAADAAPKAAAQESASP